MKTSRKYTRELHKQFNYLATWLPGTPLSLGDIGIMRGREFTKIGNLSDDKFKIDFEIEYDREPSSINHSSEGAVTITSKAAGTLSPTTSSLLDIEAGFNVSFSKTNAILFKAIGTYNHAIRDQITLGDQILRLTNNQWDKDFVVITELVEAESATILISSQKNASIDIKASGDISAAHLNIADASLGLGVSFSKGLNTEIVAGKGLTPLFKVSKVKTPWLGSPIFEAQKLSRKRSVQEPLTGLLDGSHNYFSEVTFDDIDDLEIE